MVQTLDILEEKLQGWVFQELETRTAMTWERCYKSGLELEVTYEDLDGDREGMHETSRVCLSADRRCVRCFWWVKRTGGGDIHATEIIRRL